MPLSRRELFLKCGIVPPPGPRLHKRTIQAYQDLSRESLNTGRFHSSFWGGSFPAGKATQCGRLALYTLLNLPETEPDHPKLVATSLSGKAAENQITYRWAKAGISITGVAIPDDEEQPREQLRLQDPSCWLSCAIDDVLDLRPDWPAVIPVDIKSKPDRTIEEMKVGAAGIDPRHYAQVVAYVHVCRLHHEAMGWDKLGLEPSAGGFIYYCSRDNPSNAIEYWVEYKEEEVEHAIEMLSEWRELFISKQLPERPKAWRWTEQPCKWCDLKKRCKADVQAGVTDLFASGAIEIAKESDDKYDPESIHKKVRARWGLTK